MNNLQIAVRLYLSAEAQAARRANLPPATAHLDVGSAEFEFSNAHGGPTARWDGSTAMIIAFESALELFAKVEAANVPKTVVSPLLNVVREGASLTAITVAIKRLPKISEDDMLRFALYIPPQSARPGSRWELRVAEKPESRRDLAVAARSVPFSSDPIPLFASDEAEIELKLPPSIASEWRASVARVRSVEAFRELPFVISLREVRS